MSIYQTQGIILKKTDFGEASQLFNIYSRDFGKIEVVGRGTKKIQSKLNSHLQFFAIIDLMIAKGKSFDQLTGARIIKIFPQLKTDFRKTILASFGLELIDKLTKTNQLDEKIFSLLTDYLETINKKTIVKKEDWQVIKKSFVSQLMTVLGYKPSFQIIDNLAKLNDFLAKHLDQELNSEKFINQLALD